MRRLLVDALVEEHAERVLEVFDRLVGPAEEVGQPAEVVEQATDVLAVGELLVVRAGALGVRPSEHPVALALGDERRLEVHLGGCAPVAKALGQLERTLDVFPCRLPVALAAVAARTPAEDLRSQQVVGEIRPFCELESGVEQAEGSGDAGQLVAAGAEPEEHVGALDVGELRLLGERARLGEQRCRFLQLAVLEPGPRFAGERTELEILRARRPGVRREPARTPARRPRTRSAR